eukprot:403345497
MITRHPNQAIQMSEPQNPLTNSFIDEYLATGNLDPREKLIEIGGGNQTDRSSALFEYQSMGKMNGIQLINNTNLTANTKSTDTKSRNNNQKLKSNKKQINAFMYNSSDAVSPSTTQVHSRLCGSASGSISPAITSYSNGAYNNNGNNQSLMKYSLFHMDSSNVQSSNLQESNSPLASQQNQYQNAPLVSMFQNRIPNQIGMFDKKKRSIEVMENIKNRIQQSNQQMKPQQTQSNNILTFNSTGTLNQEEQIQQSVQQELIQNKQKLISQNHLQQQKNAAIGIKDKTSPKISTFLGKFVKISKKKEEPKQNQIVPEPLQSTHSQQNNIKTLILNKNSDDTAIRRQILLEYNQRKIQQQQQNNNLQTYSNACLIKKQNDIVKENFRKALIKLALYHYHLLVNEPQMYLSDMNNIQGQRGNLKHFNISYLDDDIEVTDLQLSPNHPPQKPKIIHNMSQQPMSAQNKTSKAFTFKTKSSLVQRTAISSNYLNFEITSKNDESDQYLPLNNCNEIGAQVSSLFYNNKEEVKLGLTMPIKSQNGVHQNESQKAQQTLNVGRGKRYEDFLPLEKRQSSSNQNSKSRLRKIISNVKI